ncbi:hypothetical protein [Alistipes communis]|uniref:hypothetical protein n=1 Tax=Alistipes communis TaxID=2585118 RepID=UPI003FD7281F
MFAHNFFLLKVEFSRFVFSPRHSLNKFGSALGLSKTLNKTKIIKLTEKVFLNYKTIFLFYYKRAIRKLRFGHSRKRVREKQGPEKPERGCGASKRDRRIADRARRPPPLRQKAPGTDTAKAGDGM